MDETFSPKLARREVKHEMNMFKYFLKCGIIHG